MACELPCRLCLSDWGSMETGWPVRDGLDFSVVTDGLVFASLSDVIYVFVIDNLADVKIGLVVASFAVVIVGLAQNGIVGFSLADVIDSFAVVIDGLFAYNSATVA